MGFLDTAGGICRRPTRGMDMRMSEKGQGNVVVDVKRSFAPVRKMVYLVFRIRFAV